MTFLENIFKFHEADPKSNKDLRMWNSTCQMGESRLQPRKKKALVHKMIMEIEFKKEVWMKNMNGANNTLSLSLCLSSKHIEGKKWHTTNGWMDNNKKWKTNKDKSMCRKIILKVKSIPKASTQDGTQTEEYILNECCYECQSNKSKKLPFEQQTMFFLFGYWNVALNFEFQKCVSKIYLYGKWGIVTENIPQTFLESE